MEEPEHTVIVARHSAQEKFLKLFPDNAMVLWVGHYPGYTGLVV